ncbi:MAG TPA: M48 family metalloprotease [Solirubrobacteraceae bacterium]|nr:M48 family metalloprotease [Solirubrobacteraceae bacterium]
MGVGAIFALAGLLAFLPAVVDRWALRRGASPETLAALAIVTLFGLAAVPVAFTVCTGFLAAGGDHGAPGAAAVIGLLVVALVAGRTLARVIAIRRRWRALSQVARALELPDPHDGVKVLPVDELLAFVAGSQAFISRGLLNHLDPAQRQAVIAHEREHATRGHARLLGAARALAHGAFGLAPVSKAAAALDRELDALADRAAARRLGDPAVVQAALRSVAAATATDPRDAETLRRIERLARPDPPGRPLIDGAVRLLTLAIATFVLAAICLSIHAGTVLLGAIACALLIASLIMFTRPVLARAPAPPKDTPRPHGPGRPTAQGACRSCSTAHGGEARAAQDPGRG